MAADQTPTAHPRGPVSRAERQEQTREALVHAARAVFARDGYHGARLDQIARAAGDSKGAVYSNFENKAALFLAVQERQSLGFAVTEVITYPRRKVANVLAAAGHRGFLSVAVHDLYPEMERWAIEQDADTFAVIGRPGWLKYAKQHDGAQSLSTVTSWKRLGACQVAAATPTQSKAQSPGRA